MRVRVTTETWHLSCWKAIKPGRVMTKPVSKQAVAAESDPPVIPARPKGGERLAAEEGPAWSDAVHQ